MKAADNPHKLIPVTVGEGAAKSRVVWASGAAIRAGKTSYSSAAVLRLLDKSIEALYQEKAETVWSALFGPDDVVGLKVNCLAGRGMSTSQELVDAVSERLLEAGVAENHIIIWDRLDRDLESAGYKIYRGRSKRQCYGNNQFGYTSDLYSFGEAGSLLSRILTDQCTKVINMPILKDHGIVGVSVAMKNLFGAINNPNKYHDFVGDPYVADVCAIPAIRRKIVLSICDAFTPQYEGGPPYMPQWTWQADSLLVAKDMVAMDRIGWDAIEKQRAANGLESLKEVGREPVYIHTAADANHRLGVSDFNKIELVEV